MAKQTINLGTADKGNGDPLRTAFSKVNSNFTELYEALGLDQGGLNLGSFEFTDNTITTTDSTNIIIDQAVVMTSELEVGGDIVPNVANQHALGTPTKPWHSLYVSNNTIYIGGTAVGLDASGNLTVNGSQVTGGGRSTLVNGANTVSLESTGILTLPNGAVIRDTAGNAVAIGSGAGLTNQSDYAVAFGANAGNNTQGDYAVAIGYYAGSVTQSAATVAVGYAAGVTTQGTYAVAIGANAGSVTQGNAAVAIGYAAGGNTQGGGAVAIGLDAGYNTQGTDAVAIGYGAGATTQGANAIAIGQLAGQNSQAANSIVINATGTTLDNTTENSLVVSPIRNVGGTSGVLQYNAATKEVSYSSDISSEGNINIDINLSDSTLRRWSFGEDGDLTLPAGGDILDSTGTSVLGASNKITAQKTYTDSYSDGDGQTFTYTTGSIAVEFNLNIGLYLRDLLFRLTDYFAGNPAYPYNYSNVSLVINPGVDDLSSTVTNVTYTGGSQYTITLGTAHPEPITINDIEFTYNYINTIGLDTVNDFFGLATGDDDIEIRSGRDIDLNAADDIRIEAGDIFQLKLKNLDDNDLDDGIRIVTETDTGSKTWQFRFDGNLELPAGGTITEGVVTSNPTIQLTPASPDVASQKLVIKGGGTYDYTQNGININYYNNTALVDDTLTFYINSPTYANQTLYWWIYPQGAGIGDTESGTVVLDGASGSFSILIDSDDYEFTVRVSPEADNYDPDNLGVETGLINADAPTFNSPHHLHLTTGDLTETSIFLGTDDHNVRTTVNGGIEITTPNETNNVWQFGTDGTLYLPSIGEGGGAILRSPMNEGIGISAYNDTGEGTTYTLSVAPTGPINIPTASTGLGRLQNPDGIEILTNSGGAAKFWTFGADGNLTVAGDIRSEGNIDIEINLSDSTLRRWSFGEDGVLDLAGALKLPYGAVIRDNADNSVAFGLNAGNDTQGANAVAIGSSAGATTQGEAAVAIGQLAGQSSQAANSIVINATGAALENTTVGSLVVKPVRGIAGASLPAGFKPMAYNPTTGEFIYYDA